MLRPLRLVPDGTQIKFMRGRFAGLIVSAGLSIASIVMFFYPGLNYGVDFTGGVVVEVRLAAAADLTTVRSAFAELGLGQVKLQQVGSGDRDLLVSILPLALIGGETIRAFALIMIFGIVVGTSSSIFIASPILLFLGQKRLWPALAPGHGGAVPSAAN